MITCQQGTKQDPRDSWLPAVCSKFSIFFYVPHLPIPGLSAAPPGPPAPVFCSQYSEGFTKKTFCLQWLFPWTDCPGNNVSLRWETILAEDTLCTLRMPASNPHLPSQMTRQVSWKSISQTVSKGLSKQFSPQIGGKQPLVLILMHHHVVKW